MSYYVYSNLKRKVIIMKIRKHIAFEESNHTYTNLSTKEIYPSVTKFISKFHQPFDADKVAFNLVTTNYKYKQRFRDLPIDESVEILKSEWSKRTQIGTFIHNTLETHLQGGIVEDKSKGDKWNNRIKQLIKAYEKLNLKEIYPTHLFCPEMIVYSDDYQLAGQADLILIDHLNKSISIFDYKTNQKGIEKKGFNGRKMFSPVEHLPDANYHHYSLQLSLYAYFLEKEFNYRVNELNLLWVDTNSTDSINIEKIEIRYLHKEMDAILATRASSLVQNFAQPIKLRNQARTESYYPVPMPTT